MCIRDSIKNIFVTTSIGKALFTKLVKVDEFTVTFFASIETNYNQEPGFYSINVTAMSNSTTVSSEVILEYLPLTAFTIDTDIIKFPKSFPGSTVESIGDKNFSTRDNATIINIGNVPIDILLSATELSNGKDAIPLSNVVYSFDKDFSSEFSGILSKNLETINLGLDVDETRELSFRIVIPKNVTKGDYLGSIMLIAVPSK